MVCSFHWGGFEMGMSISMKKDTRKTNVKHNNREFSEKEKKQNSHVDFSRSHENTYLVTKNLKELYKTEFEKAQTDYNDKQKRSDRKIKNYYEHVQQGKKTSLQQEMILQVGDKDDFKDNPDNSKIANDVLEEWFEQFEDRNPNLKVYNAVIHNDEASPHMHLNFVPVATGYKRGMDKQVSFDKAIIQQDNTLNKERPFEDWRNKEVLLLENMLNERGIERDLIGTNDYKDVNDLKMKKDELRELEKQIEYKKQEFGSEREKLQNEVQELKKAVEVSKSIESIKTESVGLGAVFGGPKNVKMSEDDFNLLKTKAKATEALQLESIRHQESAVKTEDQARGWMNKYEISEDKNKRLTSEIKELKTEIDKLGETIKSQEKIIKYLEETLEVIKKNSLKFLDVAIDKMQQYVGQVRGFMLFHHFGQIAFQKGELQTHIPLDERTAAESRMTNMDNDENAKEKAKQKEIQESIDKFRKDFEEKKKNKPKESDLKENQKESATGKEVQKEIEKPVKTKDRDDFEIGG
jgi:hypothetical protein